MNKLKQGKTGLPRSPRYQWLSQNSGSWTPEKLFLDLGVFSRPYLRLGLGEGSGSFLKPFGTEIWRPTCVHLSQACLPETRPFRVGGPHGRLDWASHLRSHRFWLLSSGMSVQGSRPRPQCWLGPWARASSSFSKRPLASDCRLLPPTGLSGGGSRWGASCCLIHTVFCLSWLFSTTLRPR